MEGQGIRSERQLRKIVRITLVFMAFISILYAGSAALIATEELSSVGEGVVRTFEEQTLALLSVLWGFLQPFFYVVFGFLVVDWMAERLRLGLGLEFKKIELKKVDLPALLIVGLIAALIVAVFSGKGGQLQILKDPLMALLGYYIGMKAPWGSNTQTAQPEPETESVEVFRRQHSDSGWKLWQFDLNLSLPSALLLGVAAAFFISLFYGIEYMSATKEILLLLIGYHIGTRADWLLVRRQSAKDATVPGAGWERWEKDGEEEEVEEEQGFEEEFSEEDAFRKC